MKIAQQEINKFIQNIPTDIRSVLIYGPDNGLVYERCKYIEKFLKKKYSEISTTNIQFDDAKNSLSNVKNQLNNFSFFAKFQLFIIEDLPSKMNSELLSLIQNLQQDIFVITLAKELTPSSSLRKTYEDGKNLAAIACYHDDEKTISMIAKKLLDNNGLKISNPILDYLASNLKGDRKNIMNEINKLILYCSDKQEVTQEDIKDCCCLDLDSSYEDLYFAIANMDYKKSINKFNELLLKGISIISMIRTVGNYFLRLYQVKVNVSGGMTFDTAIKQLSPPIFIMSINIFKKHLANFSEQSLCKINQSLLELETLSKQSNYPIKQLFLKTIFKITNQSSPSKE